MFRRYRSVLSPESASSLSRLARGYECHGFPIDREELSELGLPARDAAGEEAITLERAMNALIALGEGFKLQELTSASSIEESASGGVNGEGHRPVSHVEIRSAAWDTRIEEIPPQLLLTRFIVVVMIVADW